VGQRVTTASPSGYPLKLRLIGRESRGSPSGHPSKRHRIEPTS
jgi:hypothetical protein